MKSENLKILQKHNINVPHFTVIKKKEDFGPSTLFLISSDKEYAVRSSFAGEDGKKHSFAGQFKTILNVKKENLKDAVNKVFDSMQNHNVNAYCTAKNMLNSNNGCVIVQEMVKADYSGVIFTSNPLGILNETVVVVGTGLGVNVVEDKTNTTSYYYNQDDDIYYYEQQDNSPLLKENVLKELIAVSSKIKKIFNQPTDIEFAIYNDTVYILQARPITTLSYNNPIYLDNSNIVESYPGVSLPLTQDFVKSAYCDIFQKCLLRITQDEKLVKEMDEYLKNMVAVANGRIYYRIDNWYAILKLLPFSNQIISIWQKMLGVNNKTIVAPKIKTSLKTKRKIVKSTIHYLKKTPELMEELNDDFKESLPSYEKVIDNANKIEDLLIVYYNIRKEVLSNWDITLINDMYTFIYTALSGKKNESLISNIKNLESMKPAKGIEKLIDVAKSNGVSSDTFKWYAEEYIEKYGDRCLGELKLETKTYRTHPALLFQYIENQLTDQYKEPYQPTQPKTRISKNVKKAKLGIKNREISRMNRSRLYGLTRTIFRKIGEILVNMNKIECIDDVFYLYINEITEYEKEDLKELIVKRKEEYSAYEKVSSFGRLVFDKEIINKTQNYKKGSILNKKDILVGTPTSTGIVRGRILLIDEPNAELNTEGKIIVTKSTDPGWVFLIQNCKGIISEKGSLLSHTAIISRELKKPAVVNVKDCTKILQNDDFIELDAVKGTIKILKGV